MTLRLLIFSLLILFSINSLNAQRETLRMENTGVTPDGVGANDGKIMISQDANALKVVKKHRDLNNETFPGWRVQIFFGSGRTAMDESRAAKDKFATKFGTKYGSYIVYDAPYFKVRVGDFRTRAEAMYFEKKIKTMFPSSWVVPDNVRYPDRDITKDKEDEDGE